MKFADRRTFEPYFIIQEYAWATGSPLTCSRITGETSQRLSRVSSIAVSVS